MFSDLLQVNGSSLFGIHINAIFILITPLFRIWPDYKFLIFLSDVALALSAWPLYLIARRHFSKALSLLFAGMFLLHPIVTAQPGLSDISELRFMPILFFSAFYFFETGRFWWFAGMAGLMLTIREDMGLFVIFFGVYAVLTRRELKWILTPLFAGLSWFVFMGAWLLPRLNPAGSAVRATVRYSRLGSSGREIVRNLLFKPWIAVQAAFSTPSHIGVVYGLLLTLGCGIPLLSATIVFAIPAAAELLFQEQTNLINFTAIPAVTTLMIPLVYGLARLDRITSRRFGLREGKTAAAAGVVIFFLGLSAFHTWFNPEAYTPRYNYDAALEALHQVPDSAKVIMPEYMLVYGSTSQTVRGYHQITYAQEMEGRIVLDEDYVILDRHVPARKGEGRYFQGLSDATDFVISSPDFRLVYSRDDIELYVRNDIRL
jgi:hypothetical protein